MPELLAPAGDPACIEAAIHYGADAIYMGGPKLQLRSDKVGLDMADLARAIARIHAASKKAYITVNAFAGNSEAAHAADYARELEAAGADAAIISDLGVFTAFRAAAKNLELHISTQANCQNYLTARAYYDMGASRIILGREMSLEDIAQLRVKTPPALVLETFVHGAMCMAFSGRCHISAYLTGRSANAGLCTQPCRWNYALMEEKRPGEYFPVEETEKGTAIFSSADLCCIDILDRLAEAGVDSFKIEGRMKSDYYVGTVVNAYRMCMDGLASVEYCLAELDTVSHRPYSHGFYLSRQEASKWNDGQYRQSCAFVGMVTECRDGEIKVIQRNRFCVGDELEAVVPGRPFSRFTVTQIKAADGTPQQAAYLVQQEVTLPCPLPLSPGDLLRRRESV